MKHHLKHMLIGGGAIFAVLLLLRVDLRTALTYALLLSCPLGMVGMMFMMNKGGHGEHDHGAGGHDHCGGGHQQEGTTSSTGHETHQHTDHTLPEVPLTRENHERIP
ncbi:MAG: hypothetical protein J0I40_09970 [Cellulomonas sp.]|uniref:hypothetical protein n=1 Tax=Cellulomonas sp. 73-92 TaxID=1895740 RepID=UPI0009294E65|nr:hypothetical protein [Cellulomonas sp. 73-92]MBN9375700.1 hypothetical protein [Cellulomonas sp.]OJV75981.1 MAG: hypothetical protein BGO37_07040 [Cellulomonas sp. 73-92]